MGGGREIFVGNNCMPIFGGEGHLGLSDFLVQVIDVTDVNNPTERESFWIEKLNSYVPRGLNLREEV
jgi:hypothetical protein